MIHRSMKKIERNIKSWPFKSSSGKRLFSSPSLPCVNVLIDRSIDLWWGCKSHSFLFSHSFDRSTCNNRWMRVIFSSVGFRLVSAKKNFTCRSSILLLNRSNIRSKTRTSTVSISRDDRRIRRKFLFDRRRSKIIFLPRCLRV